jgi:RNA polymerase sigma-70 factor (ECF subfamily)
MPVAQPRSFQTTRWSLVVAAGGTTSPVSKAALDELCRLYWYPVFAFIRRSGNSADDAEDLTQGFFADLLQRDDFGTADPTRGKFRSWLLGCVKHYLANRRDHAAALKRGGGTPPLSIDRDDAEARYAYEPVDGVTPEQLYLRRWAMQLIGRVLAELREEMVRASKVRRFDLLEPYLVEEGDLSYAQVAELLESNANNVKQAVSNLREKFRGRLRAEIAGTVMSIDEVDEEIRLLLAALA